MYKKPLNVAVLVLLALSLVANIVLVVKRHNTPQTHSQSVSQAGDVDKNAFQGVFLKSGSVYFGKLQSIDNNYYKMTDIYYLSKASDATNNNAESLVKLGSEPHQPQDTMYIERSSVDFWENLQNANQFNGKLR